MNRRNFSCSAYDPTRVHASQRGASLVEFSIVALSVILVGLFTLQLGLIYQAKTTLNYAVFEAARTGATNNASISAIRDELGYRLAPLHSGDGTQSKALLAIAASSLKVKDPLNTKVVILNPTMAAFNDWAIRDPDTGERFIPVNHLRHQTYAIGQQSGLSLRDANILKLQVTHGMDLRVPVAGKLMAAAMKWIDTDNALYYLRDKWPLQSVATVRMQSNSLESAIGNSVTDGAAPSGELGNASPLPEGLSPDNENELANTGGSAGSGDLEGTPPADTVAVPPESTSPDCDEHYAQAAMPTLRLAELSSSSVLMNTSQFRRMLARR